MTQTNAAATTEAAPAAPKAPTKMARARELFAEVKAMETFAEGDTARKVFLRRAVADIGLTESGAQTYYNNLQREAGGKDLYYRKPASAAPKAEGETSPEAGATDPQAQAEDGAQAQAKAEETGKAE